MFKLKQAKTGVLFIVTLCSIFTLSFLTRASIQKGTLIYETIHSPSLEANLLGDSPDRSVIVYLPPSYQKSPMKRYPVIYLLHGVLDRNRRWTDNDPTIQKIVDDLIAKGTIREMIVVMPDVFGIYTGTYYTNSVTTGNWEDFITKDLVAYVDSKYRTLPQSARRGIAGHSMGGYGAFKLAMKHPEIYGAVYALSPCCLGWAGDLTTQNPAWLTTLAFNDAEQVKNKLKNLRSLEEFYPFGFLSLSTAFSPNPNRPPFFADYPVEQVEGKLRLVEPAYGKWSANFPLLMLDQYRANLLQLRGIRFDVGKKDEFLDIPPNCKALTQGLKNNGISHIFEEYDGDHSNRVRERIETKVLPFFSDTIAN